jgi:Holliday junction resolvasome RuvABC ATP-dependent DNA helicase subunit
MRGQTQLEFFDMGSEPPSVEARRDFLDPSNPISPYFGFIGNRRAVDKLIRIDFQRLGNYNHFCNLPVAFIGQAGCGKNELQRRHCKANKLPTVEISPKSIKSVQDIFNKIAQTCDEADIPLVQMVRENNYVFPPINVFIDEVHALANPIVQGILKATEADDAMLVTERGLTAKCKYVHWMIATTDRGKLFDAFDTRFSKVVLNLYTKNEMAQVVQTHNPDWPLDVCRLVAHYCSRVPREALTFAKEMRLEYNMNPQLSWEKISERIANDNEIDAFGMTYKRLAILKALGQGPVGEKRMPVIAGVKIEELNKFIMPWLMEATDDQAALVTVSSKGFTITEAGLQELDLRRIPHKGDEALAA